MDALASHGLSDKVTFATTGDIPAAQTHVAAARTLGVALGISEAQLGADFFDTAGGKVVRTALTGM